MKQFNPYLKKALKEQMLQPIIKCELCQCYCRYTILAYCLIEFSLYGCEYQKVKTAITFKEKGSRNEPILLST